MPGVIKTGSESESVPRLLGALLRGLLLVAVVGCTHNGRVAIEGTVTLDGRPLHEAQIAFFPMPGCTGPTVGGDIIDGRFAIPADKGPLAGNYRVVINKSGPTGRQVRDLRRNTIIDEYAQILPARYNERTELEAEVTAGGPNRFEFALMSP